jgi:tripeptide aminopeptidase
MEPPVLERFLRYVRYDTQSDESSTTFPSTEKQLFLLRDLAAELRALGLSDAAVDEHGYVMATVPATSRKPGVPTIGFIAHVDTSPEMSGANVTPIVHRAYDGRDLVLPDNPSAVLRMAIPELTVVGHDIVTALRGRRCSGRRQAGVASDRHSQRPQRTRIPHGPIRIAFTPDEEVMRDADPWAVQAPATRTDRGGPRRDRDRKPADAMTVTHGFNTHPGYARAAW